MKLPFSEDESNYLGNYGIDIEELVDIANTCRNISELRRKVPELYAMVLTPEENLDNLQDDLIVSIREKFEEALQPQKTEIDPVEFLKRGWIERAKAEFGELTPEYTEKIQQEFRAQLNKGLQRGKYGRSAQIYKNFIDCVDLEQVLDEVIGKLLEKNSINKAKALLSALGKDLEEYQNYLGKSFENFLFMNNLEAAEILERQFGDFCNFESRVAAVLPRIFQERTWYRNVSAIELVKKIAQKYPNVDLKSGAVASIKYLLSASDYDVADKMHYFFRISKQDKDMREAAEAAIPLLLSGSQIKFTYRFDSRPPFSEVEKICREYGIPLKEREYAIRAIEECLSIIGIAELSGAALTRIARIQEQYELEDLALAEYAATMPIYLNSLIATFSLSTVSELQKFTQENHEYVAFINSTPEAAIALQSEDLKHVNILHITLLEAEKLKRKGVDLEGAAKTQNYEELFHDLQRHVDMWKYDPLIANAFKKGAEIFGYNRMFQFIKRKHLSRHDALHAFTQVLAMYEKSTLEPQVFFNNVLQQVQMDSARYNEGTAHHHLNGIAQSTGFDFDTILELAQIRQRDGIENLDSLVEMLQDPSKIFASWKTVKKYNEMTRLLANAKVLKEMQVLRHQGKDKLYEFIKKLIFHSASNININAVLAFWREPDSFFERDDDHTDVEVHNRKKPSNYTHIPHLDLDPEELRDALVEGELDTLQVFTPMEIRYVLPKDVNAIPDVRMRAVTVMNTLKASNMKQARKLFSAVNNLLKPHNISAQDYFSEGQAIAIPVQTGKEIKNLIVEHEKVQKQNKGGQTIIAKIHAKSSVEGILAGNDTSCCMPFGSGKNNVYMFNPTTAMFTLQIEREDGSRRTVAQSLLTKDKDIEAVISEILPQLERVDIHLSELLPESILEGDKEEYMSADNVEVSPNYSTEEYQQLIELLYRDFFKEYMDRFSEEENIHSEWMPVGLGYSDALRGLPRRKNTYAPIAPVGYSDKTHSEVLALELDVEMPELQKTVIVHNRAEDSKKKPGHVKGVSEMDFTDTLSVAYLEGKAYSDNASLIVNLHNIENALIAKDINNAAKKRPNMSLKYQDDTGKMRGYIIAYEGEFDDGDTLESVLYIADLASDDKSVRAGGSLIKAFVESYKRNYLDKDRLTPLYLEARESTSYHIIQKQLEKISKEIGVEFEVEEMGVYQEGVDTMHPVFIRPKLTSSN